MTRCRTIVLGALLAGCAGAASTGGADDYDQKAADAMRRDFQAKGIATVDRLAQDDVQAACTRYRDHPPPELAARLQAAELAKVKLPADGKLLGDWKEGEKIAQSGVGLTWADKADAKAGGNCYACHQLTKQEVSFGTLGPSLYGFGRQRGNSPDVQKYVWSKIYDAKAFNLCSNMPRFGHSQILSEAQIRHVVALLLDPESPVNR